MKRTFHIPTKNDTTLDVRESAIPDQVLVTLTGANHSTTAVLTRSQFAELAALGTYSHYGANCITWVPDTDEEA